MKGMLGITLMVLFAATVAIADDAPFAEYRYSKDLGQIQITMGFRSAPRTSRPASRISRSTGS